MPTEGQNAGGGGLLRGGPWRPATRWVVEVVVVPVAALLVLGVSSCCSCAGAFVVSLVLVRRGRSACAAIVTSAALS